MMKKRVITVCIHHDSIPYFTLHKRICTNDCVQCCEGWLFSCCFCALIRQNEKMNSVWQMCLISPRDFPFHCFT